QSEVLYQRALQKWERAFGPDHGNVAFALTNLALLFSLQSKYEQAEPLYWRALAINEQQWGSEHVEVATVLHGLANLYREQGQYEQAGPLYRSICLGDASARVC
ncbi:MAG TPA: tetratricopeptide repeat protein, partial [Ktedonobacteraceae bacterium]|nr:tetratricopeptide repeat protein [Ktedonobacteraceae bacterium]